MKIISVISICGSLIIYLFYKKKYLYYKLDKFIYPKQKIIFIKSNKTLEIYKNYENYKNYTNYTDTESWKLKYYHNQKLTKEQYITTDDIDKIENINQIIPLINTKKIINITTGGIYGYYDTGTCKIIKDNFCLKNYIFSGVSAGSWNSLFMVYKNNPDELIEKILTIDFQNLKSIKNLQLILKEKILSNYSTADFELNKLFISVCVFENYLPNNYIYTDFNNLEDAIDCCIASSNIPLITGDFICRYKNKISFDGGFLLNQHILLFKPVFIIKNSIWGRNRFFSLFNTFGVNLKNLYMEGQMDTIDNINYLETIFSTSVSKIVV